MKCPQCKAPVQWDGGDEGDPVVARRFSYAPPEPPAAPPSEPHGLCQEFGIEGRTDSLPRRPNHLKWNGHEWVDHRCGCRYHPDDDKMTHGGAPHVHLCDAHRPATPPAAPEEDRTPSAHPMEVWDRYDSAHGPGGTPAEPQRPDEDRSVPPPGWRWLIDAQGRLTTRVRLDTYTSENHSLAFAWAHHDAITAPLRARVAELEAALREQVTAFDEARAAWGSACARADNAVAERGATRARAEAAEERWATASQVEFAERSRRLGAERERDRARALLAQCEPELRHTGLRGDEVSGSLRTLLTNIRQALGTPKGDE